jgi:hypothetical protein
MTYIDRRTKQADGTLDNVDRPINARTETTRIG